MAEVDEHLVWSQRSHRIDQFVPRAAGYRIVWIHDGAPGEDHITGIKRRAVLPRHTVTKVIRDRAPVRTNTAVLNRRNAAREIGDQVTGIVLIDEITGPEL